MGLLFGYYSSSSSTSSSSTSAQKTKKRNVTIVDAEEMEYPKLSLGNNSNNEVEDTNRRAAILQKIELHQKVFPQHHVVGWYRVVAADAINDDVMNIEGGGGEQQQQQRKRRGMLPLQPTEEDLIMTQMEMAQYCHHSDDGGDVSSSPLFVLMDASNANEDVGAKKKSIPNTTTTTTALEELESGDELPLTVYETLTTSRTSADASSVVFVNAEFELETYEPERIAVEWVFKTQPPPTTAAAVVASSLTSTATTTSVGENEDYGTNRKMGKKSKKDVDVQKQQQQQQQSLNNTKPAYTRGPTELDTQLTSLQSSIHDMNLRIRVLLEYLDKVERKELSADDTLLRSIDGVVRQLPLVLAALEERSAAAEEDTGRGGDGSGRAPLRDLENEYSNAMLLSYLACTAKTAKAVHVFCEKFRIASESSGRSDPRRSLY